jgi:hypothetical protein
MQGRKKIIFHEKYVFDIQGQDVLPLSYATIPLCQSKVFISGSCSILVLTTVLRHLRRVDAKKFVKNYQRPTTSPKNVIRKHLEFPHTYLFFKFYCDYDLNLCRNLNPELPPMRDLGSPYFLVGHIFVCETLSGGIKLNYLYSRKQSCTYKSAILAEI